MKKQRSRKKNKLVLRIFLTQMKNKIKIIFLDIDGVLNSQRFYESEFRKHNESLMHDEYGQIFDPLSSDLLNKLIRETKAKVVISSTWRHNGFQEMKDMWRDRKMEGEVIGITDNFRTTLIDN